MDGLCGKAAQQFCGVGKCFEGHAEPAQRLTAGRDIFSEDEKTGFVQRASPPSGRDALLSGIFLKVSGIKAVVFALLLDGSMVRRI